MVETKVRPIFRGFISGKQQFSEMGPIIQRFIDEHVEADSEKIEVFSAQRLEKEIRDYVKTFYAAITKVEVLQRFIEKEVSDEELEHIKYSKYQETEKAANEILSLIGEQFEAYYHVVKHDAYEDMTQSDHTYLLTIGKQHIYIIAS